MIIVSVNFCEMLLAHLWFLKKMAGHILETHNEKRRVRTSYHSCQTKNIAMKRKTAKILDSLAARLITEKVISIMSATKDCGTLKNKDLLCHWAGH